MQRYITVVNFTVNKSFCQLFTVKRELLFVGVRKGSDFKSDPLNADIQRYNIPPTIQQAILKNLYTVQPAPNTQTFPKMDYIYTFSLILWNPPKSVFSPRKSPFYQRKPPFFYKKLRKIRVVGLKNFSCVQMVVQPLTVLSAVPRPIF